MKEQKPIPSPRPLKDGYFIKPMNFMSTDYFNPLMMTVTDERHKDALITLVQRQKQGLNYQK